MRFFENKRIKRGSIIALAVLLVIGLSVGGVALYANDYYRTDTAAVAAFAATGTVSPRTLESGAMVWESEGAHTGFIFYPGGKVEYTAYAPLMQALAAHGVVAVLLPMPLNLAVLDVNAADGVTALFPDVTDWYMGGHSLGGSMAAAYLADHTEEFRGLVLLGSYSTADLSTTSLRVLSVYGSEDGVMRREKYEENKVNLPKDYKEVVLEGGCHAYFGMYGAQDGDGTPTLSPAEQIVATANAILLFMA